MDQEEEKEKINKIVSICAIHKLMMNKSWSGNAERQIVQAAQACFMTVFMMGKGFTTEEEITKELRGQCPNCYWDNLIWMTVGLLEGLGLPIHGSDIQEELIEEPKPNIWKN